MSVQSSRTISLAFSGDASETITPLAAVNVNSALYRQVVNLASGVNTINVPTGVTIAGVTIVPPANNPNSLTLKGSAGDVGVVLHKTDPTSLGLDSSTTTFVINASSATNGVVLIWS